MSLSLLFETQNTPYGRPERAINNREAAKPKRGRGREPPRTRQLRWCGSALYCTTAKAGHDCVGRVRVRESGNPPNLDEGPITPLRQAQQAEHFARAAHK